MKDLVLAIGVLLGIVRPQTDPSIVGRIYRDDDAVYLNLEVRDAMTEDAKMLVEAGNPLVLTATVRAAGRPLHGAEANEAVDVACVHRLFYDPVRSVYSVEIGETGSTHETSDRDAAFSIFTQFYGVSIGSVEVVFARLPTTVIAQCELDLDAVRGFDSGVLWNYRRPELRFSVSMLTEVPY